MSESNETKNKKRKISRSRGFNREGIVNEICGYLGITHRKTIHKTSKIFFSKEELVALLNYFRNYPLLNEALKNDKRESVKYVDDQEIVAKAILDKQREIEHRRMLGIKEPPGEIKIEYVKNQKKKNKKRQTPNE